MYTLTLTFAASTVHYLSLDGSHYVSLSVPSHSVEISVDDSVARVLRVEDGALIYTGSDTLTLDYYDDTLGALFDDDASYYYSSLTLYSPLSGEYHSRLTAYGRYQPPMTIYYGRGFGTAGDLIEPHTSYMLAPDVVSSTSTQTLLTGYSIESILLGFLLVLFAVMTLFRPRR